MIYFYYGDEDYNIELEIKRLRKKLLDNNFATMNFKKVDNPSVSELLLLLKTQPMMFGNMIIVISCGTYFSETFEDEQLKEISKALEDNIESLCIIFTAILPRNEGKKIDSRRKIYKTITKYAFSKEFPTFKTYKLNDISNWIEKEAKKNEITIERDAILMMIEQIGNNLREFTIEIQKLKLLAYPKTTITKEMVKEICITNEDLFLFTDYLLKRDKGHALLEFQKILDKRHPLEIISTLQTMLRKWIIIKSKSGKKSLFELSKLTGQHEFVVKKTLEKMKNISLADLIILKQNLVEVEYKIKSGQSIDAVDEMTCALLKS